MRARSYRDWTASAEPVCGPRSLWLNRARRSPRRSTAQRMRVRRPAIPRGRWDKWRARRCFPIDRNDVQCRPWPSPAAAHRRRDCRRRAAFPRPRIRARQSQPGRACPCRPPRPAAISIVLPGASGCSGKGSRRSASILPFVEAVNDHAVARSLFAIADRVGRGAHAGIKMPAVAAEGEARIERLLGCTRQGAVIGKVGQQRRSACRAPPATACSRIQRSHSRRSP